MITIPGITLSGLGVIAIFIFLISMLLAVLTATFEYPAAIGYGAIIALITSIILLLWVGVVSLFGSTYTVKEYPINNSYKVSLRGKTRDVYTFNQPGTPNLSGVSINNVYYDEGYDNHLEITTQNGWLLPWVKVVDKTYEVNMYTNR